MGIFQTFLRRSGRQMCTALFMVRGHDYFRRHINKKNGSQAGVCECTQFWFK